MHEYFCDVRFAMKKPDLQGNWQERYGDNFHSQRPDGSWQQHRNRFHIGPEYLKKDTRRPHVFVSRHYWYLGRNAVEVPAEFKPLIGGRGIRVRHPSGLPERFVRCVASEFEPGIHGLPNDNPDIGVQGLKSNWGVDTGQH